MERNLMEAKRFKFLVVVSFALAFCLGSIVFYFRTGITFWGWAPIVVWGGTVILRYWSWKCTFCNRLMKQGWRQRRCPHCGENLIIDDFY